MDASSTSSLHLSVNHWMWLGVSNIIRSAMASWAKSMSRELPPAITINSILPGKIDTDRLSVLANAMAKASGAKPDEIYAKWTQEIPEGRIGRPEELAAVVAFIASPAGAFLRGISLPVDGGQLRSI
jgi:3-oxoacyl-[acyl-carrier protein] reductase